MEEVKYDVVKILADPSDHLGTQVVMNYPRGWGVGGQYFVPSSVYRSSIGAKTSVLCYINVYNPNSS